MTIFAIKLKAIQEQIRQLVEAEGSDTLLERNLKVELREVYRSIYL
jgi:hypothetical protein